MTDISTYLYITSSCVNCWKFFYITEINNENTNPVMIDSFDSTYNEQKIKFLKCHRI